MALNSITIDGELIGEVIRRRIRNIDAAIVFLLKHQTTEKPGYGHETQYIVYAPLNDPAGIALEQLNPKNGAYIGVIGKARGVEKIDFNGRTVYLPLIQLTQMNVGKQTKNSDILTTT